MKILRQKTFSFHLDGRDKNGRFIQIAKKGESGEIILLGPKIYMHDIGPNHEEHLEIQDLRGKSWKGERGLAAGRFAHKDRNENTRGTSTKKAFHKKSDDGTAEEWSSEESSSVISKKRL